MPLSFADIINIDITVYLDGFHGDCSKTYAVGDIDNKAKKLIKTTEECLNIGIDLCHPGRISISRKKGALMLIKKKNFEKTYY